MMAVSYLKIFIMDIKKSNKLVFRKSIKSILD